MSGRSFNKFNYDLLKQSDPRVKVAIQSSEAGQVNQQTIKYKVENGPVSGFHSNKGDIEIKKRRLIEEGDINSEN